MSRSKNGSKNGPIKNGPVKNVWGRRVLIGAGLLMVTGLWFGLRTLLSEEPVKVTALFTSAVGLYPGSDVQVLGVPVGTVTSVQAEGEHVRVTMELDPDQPVAANTQAVIIAPTMVSDRFVQLTKPLADKNADALDSGTVIQASRTAVPVEIDELYSGLQSLSDALGPDGANKHGALSDLITTGANNLDGQGKSLNTMIREFGKASATLDNVDTNFFGTLSNLNTLNEMLVANDTSVKQVNQQFAEVAGYLAEDRDEMGEAATNLSEAMSVLDGFISKNRTHLKSSVENLVPIAETLTKNKDSLDETVRLAPILLHNLIGSYDAKYNMLAGRGNVNEVSIWSSDGLTAKTSDAAPPTMLDGAPR